MPLQSLLGLAARRTFGHADTLATQTLAKSHLPSAFEHLHIVSKLAILDEGLMYRDVTIAATLKLSAPREFLPFITHSTPIVGYFPEQAKQ